MRLRVFWLFGSDSDHSFTRNPVKIHQKLWENLSCGYWLSPFYQSIVSHLHNLNSPVERSFRWLNRKGSSFRQLRLWNGHCELLPNVVVFVHLLIIDSLVCVCICPCIYSAGVKCPAFFDNKHCFLYQDLSPWNFLFSSNIDFCQQGKLSS